MRTLIWHRGHISGRWSSNSNEVRGCFQFSHDYASLARTFPLLVAEIRHRIALPRDSSIQKSESAVGFTQ